MIKSKARIDVDGYFAILALPVFFVAVLFLTGLFCGWKKPFNSSTADNIFLGCVVSTYCILWAVIRWRVRQESQNEPFAEENDEGAPQGNSPNDD